MEKAYQICIEMFSQRGYKEINTSETDKIIALHSNDLGKEEIVCAFFVEAQKLNIDSVHTYMNLMDKLEINHGIIIYMNTITPSAKKAVQTSLDMEIELFKMKELQYNLTKHRLVPLHELVSKEEHIFLKSKFGNNLPKIYQSDPVVRFYNFKKGNIIRIIRKNNLIAYRIVIGN